MSRYHISLAVQKELKERNLSADEVLRKALNVRNLGFTTSDGVHLPEGTKLVAWYKGNAISAIINEGAIEAEGKTYTSLSAAAAHYTKRPTTNGWDFWYIQTPGKSEFVLANTFKQAA